MTVLQSRMLFPGRANRDAAEMGWAAHGGGEDVTSEKAYQGGHLQVHAPLAV